MTESEFSRIADFASERYGLDLGQKKALVEKKMDNYLKAKGFKSYDEYMNIVEYEMLGTEEQNFIDRITTNHTYFLREPEQFYYFRDEILPELREKETATKNLRIWCAGASTGEEPYTIAMLLREFFGDAYEEWDTGLMATDLSRKTLEKAVKGIYRRQQLEGLPKHWIKDYFLKVNEKQFEVKQDIRKNVIFRQFNLINPFPFKNKLHVIFLRNVMRYLEEEVNRDLIERIRGFLEPGGYLITGMTETIDASAAKLEYVGSSIYRRPLV